LDRLPFAATVKVVDDKGIYKWFYEVAGAKSVPSQFAKILIPNDVQSVQVGGKTRVPVFIGSDEARMMINLGLFKSPGDSIDGLFGNDVAIAGVLPRTGTVLDEFHYVPAGFNWALPE
jgi:hypothetical protein